MTSQEMKEKYTMLYDYMSASRKTENMMLFGHVMTEMMDWMIANKPEAAQEWIDKLDAIKWRNYLTPREAEAIVSEMIPKAPWTRDQWNKAMDAAGLDKEEEMCYNPCALFVTMSAIYTDHSQTLSKIVGTPIDEIPEEELLEAIYYLALDKLKDKDKRYNVRKYFLD